MVAHRRWQAYFEKRSTRGCQPTSIGGWWLPTRRVESGSEVVYQWKSGDPCCSRRSTDCTNRETAINSQLPIPNSQRGCDGRIGELEVGLRLSLRPPRAKSRGGSWEFVDGVRSSFTGGCRSGRSRAVDASRVATSRRGRSRSVRCLGRCCGASRSHACAVFLRW